MVFYTIFIILSAISIAVVNGDCHSYFAAHEIIQAPNQVLTFDDAAGFREVKANRYNVNNCGPHKSFATGQQYIGNYTLMGHHAQLNNGDCLIKKVKDRSVYDSMQALVIRTNGWTIKPQAIDLDDMDAQSGVDSDDGWKESMALFGVHRGKLVKPIMKLYDGTLLESKAYFVPSAAMKEMELSLGDSEIPGGEYASSEMINCPFGRDNEESKKCRMTAHFEEPVDTLVFLYAVTQKSKTDPNAAVFFSEILISCGCRCKQTDLGTRPISANVPGVPNQCVQTQSIALKTQCDLLGNKWCSKTDMIAYKVTGPMLANGNYPCEQLIGEKVLVTDDFTPDKGFVPNTV